MLQNHNNPPSPFLSPWPYLQSGRRRVLMRAVQRRPPLVRPCYLQPAALHQVHPGGGPGPHSTHRQRGVCTHNTFTQLSPGGGKHILKQTLCNTLNQQRVFTCNSGTLDREERNCSGLRGSERPHRGTFQCSGSSVQRSRPVTILFWSLYACLTLAVLAVQLEAHLPGGSARGGASVCSGGPSVLCSAPGQLVPEDRRLLG